MTLQSPTRKPGKKRGPYAKSAQTRQRAVDAAIEIFSSTGFHGTTLTDIADRLGMTLTGLQFHFPTKDALLAAVLEERDRRSRETAAISENEDATEKFIDIVVRNQQERELSELHTVLSAEATSRDHPAHDYFVNNYADKREAGRRYFQWMMDAGKLGSAVDASSLATLLMAVSDGLQLQWLLDPTSVDVRAEMRSFLTAGIHGIADGTAVVPLPGTETPDEE